MVNKVRPIHSSGTPSSRGSCNWAEKPMTENIIGDTLVMVDRGSQTYVWDGRAWAGASSIPTARQRLALLGAKPVGFNYYSLIYEAVLSIANHLTNRATQLAYIKATGANIIRVALPCFSSAEYLTRVHSTATMPLTMEDSNLRASYISALDSAFNDVAALGMKLHISDFWGQAFLPVALGRPLQMGTLLPLH